MGMMKLVYLIAVFLLSHVTISLRFSLPNYRRAFHLSQQKGNQNEPEKKKSTKFDRVIDDFIGKRYGAGEAFYGKRMSDLDEDTYEK